MRKDSKGPWVPADILLPGTQGACCQVMENGWEEKTEV